MSWLDWCRRSWQRHLVVQTMQRMQRLPVPLDPFPPCGRVSPTTSLGCSNQPTTALFVIDGGELPPGRWKHWLNIADEMNISAVPFLLDAHHPWASLVTIHDHPRAHLSPIGIRPGPKSFLMINRKKKQHQPVHIEPTPPPSPGPLPERQGRRFEEMELTSCLKREWETSDGSMGPASSSRLLLQAFRNLSVVRLFF